MDLDLGLFVGQDFTFWHPVDFYLIETLGHVFAAESALEHVIGFADVDDFALEFQEVNTADEVRADFED